MFEFLRKKKVLVVLGSGGVGKTTSSIGLATFAAREGMRVGLLSIDPAKRLAAALGLDFGGEPKVIDFADLPMKGSLEASMLDQKAVLDQMVQRYAPSEELAQKILTHSLYVIASTRLAGSMEYMALARLQEMIENDRFDLVVLDTPPDSSALDFLSRPDILARFKDQKVMNWLVKPFHIASKLGITRLMTIGEKLMGGVAQVTGIKALHSFADFLVLIQHVIDGFHSASERLLTTLRNPQTAFLLVSTPANSCARSSLALAQQLQGIGYSLDGLIFNRTLPGEIVSALNSSSSESRFVSRLRQRKIVERATIEELRKRCTQTFYKDLLMLEIEETDYPIHSLQSVYRFAGGLR